MFEWWQAIAFLIAGSALSMGATFIQRLWSNRDAREAEEGDDRRRLESEEREARRRTQADENEVVPHELRQQIVQLVMRRVLERGMGYGVRPFVNVDREAGWEEFVVEVVMDEPADTRDEFWTELGDAVDELIESWPISKQPFGQVIDISVRPASD